MARLAGVDIPSEKRVVISLTYIYGIGDTTAKKICKAAGVNEDIRVKNLTDEQLVALRTEVAKHKTEGDLRRDEHEASYRNRLLPWPSPQERSSCPWPTHQDQCPYS